MNISTKILNSLKEMDHEKKHEDYTNASRNFDDIFLDGDFIKSNQGVKITYRIIDDTNHQLLCDDKGVYSAFSKDGYHWKIAQGRKPIDEMEGTPINIAKYLAKLNDTIK